MIRPAALPFYQQILYDIFLPPVGAGIWWLMSRGWAISVQGGTVSETTKRRQGTMFWVLLIFVYAVGITMTFYAYFT